MRSVLSSRPLLILSAGIGLSIATAIASFAPATESTADAGLPVLAVSALPAPTPLPVVESSSAGFDQLSAQLSDHRAARQHALSLRQNPQLWSVNATPGTASPGIPSSARATMIPIADASSLELNRTALDRPVHVTDAGAVRTLNRADSIIAEAIAFQSFRDSKSETGVTSPRHSTAASAGPDRPEVGGETASDLDPDLNVDGTLRTPHDVQVIDERAGGERNVVLDEPAPVGLPDLHGAGIDLPYEVGSLSGLAAGGEATLAEGAGLKPGETFPDYELYVGDNQGGYTAVTPEPTTLASLGVALALLKRRRA